MQWGLGGVGFGGVCMVEVYGYKQVPRKMYAVETPYYKNFIHVVGYVDLLKFGLFLLNRCDN